MEQASASYVQFAASRVGSGSTLVPFGPPRRSSKCRWLKPFALPVWFTVSITSPAVTGRVRVLERRRVRGEVRVVVGVAVVGLEVQRVPADVAGAPVPERAVAHRVHRRALGRGEVDTRMGGREPLVEGEALHRAVHDRGLGCGCRGGRRGREARGGAQRDDASAAATRSGRRRPRGRADARARGNFGHGRCVGIHGPTFEPGAFNRRSIGVSVPRRSGRQLRRVLVVPGPLVAQLGEIEPVDGLRLTPGPGPHRRLGVAAQ